MTTTEQIVGRMRRKIDIIRLDRKAVQDPVYHDMGELLSLLDMLERQIGGSDGRS